MNTNLKAESLNDSEWGIDLRMWKHVKEVALKILNNGREYVMDLQCIKQVDSAKGVFFALE